MATSVKRERKSNEYSRFLNKIQREKMKELWDNRFDEEWEKAKP